MIKKNQMYKLFYNFENVPDSKKEKMKRDFMKNRPYITRLYRNIIGNICKDWELNREEPMYFGEYLEDINPEFANFVIERMQPLVNIYNWIFRLMGYKCLYRIDEYIDIVGYLSSVKDSKLYITLKEYNKET